MSNEAQVRSSLIINKGYLQYSSQPTAFVANVTGTKGPVPGAFTATPAGVDVDLSQLTTPGLCHITNLDATNYITVGIWDPETTKFYPLAELLPGETYVLRLSRDLRGEYGTGTGTTGAYTNTLRVRSYNQSCNVYVGAFEA